MVNKWKSLFEVGQQLAEEVNREDAEFFNLVYRSARQLVETNLIIILGKTITGNRPYALPDDGEKKWDWWIHEFFPQTRPENLKKICSDVLWLRPSCMDLNTQEQIKQTFLKTESDDAKEIRIASWLSTPIYWERRVVGVLITYHSTQENAYDENDRELLNALSKRLSILLKNRRLIKREKALIENSKKWLAFTSAKPLSEDEAIKFVVELFYKLAGALMDTSNMLIYVKDIIVSQRHFLLAYENKIRINLSNREENDRLEQQPMKQMVENVAQKREPTLLQTRTEIEESLKKLGTTYLFNDIPATWMAVPLRLKNKQTGGTFVVYHPTREYAYDKDDLNILEAMSDQVAIAIDSVRLYSTVSAMGQALKSENTRLKETNTKLEKINKRQESLIEVARGITSKIDLSEGQILELIYQQASKVMDTNNMYIALYDEDSDEVRFPLAFKEGKKINVSTRKAGKGRTEEIIRTKKPILHRTKQESEIWYAQPNHQEYIGDTLASWVGVPMLMGERILGVIANYHPTKDGIYDIDDQRILAALANQATIALQNSKLYQEKNEQALQLEKANRRIAETQEVLTRSLIANDLVHRLNNLAGTTPIWIAEIREELDKEEPQKPDITECLDHIEEENRQLLRAVEQLKHPEHKSDTDITLVLKVLLRQVRIQYYHEIRSKQLEIIEGISSTYKVNGIASSLAHAIYSIISNGIESILEKGQGVLTINTVNNVSQLSSEGVKIEITDTGKGISRENLEKIFIPYFSTKGSHRGYGLWRAKTVVEECRGKITVESQEDKGATFVIWLPKSI
jgi:GAF domain-containing protein